MLSAVRSEQMHLAHMYPRPHKVAVLAQDAEREDGHPRVFNCLLIQVGPHLLSPCLLHLAGRDH